MSAYEEIVSILAHDEVIEAIRIDDDDFSYDIKVPGFIKGKIITLEEAKPYLEGWSFENGFGEINCLTLYIWSNKRIFFCN